MLLIDSPRDMGRDDVSLDRYYAREWHEREVRTVWQKTWQMACRVEDIPEVGDSEIYEIVHDSLIIVRTGPAETDIRAYVNSCLHRGTIPAHRARQPAPHQVPGPRHHLGAGRQARRAALCVGLPAGRP